LGLLAAFEKGLGSKALVVSIAYVSLRVNSLNGYSLLHNDCDQLFTGMATNTGASPRCRMFEYQASVSHPFAKLRYHFSSGAQTVWLK
jgi:hypothetical protein